MRVWCDIVTYHALTLSVLSYQSPNPNPLPFQYEQELTLLTQQLAETQAMLAETQTRLLSEEQARSMIHQDWQSKLEFSEEKMKQQQQEKDQQMKSIIQRWAH